MNHDNESPVSLKQLNSAEKSAGGLNISGSCGDELFDVRGDHFMRIQEFQRIVIVRVSLFDATFSG